MGARRVVCLYLMKITLKPKESKRGKAIFLKKEIILCKGGRECLVKS